MIIRCESCGLAYALDDSKVQPGGTKVRCSSCKHVFTVFPADEPSSGGDLFPPRQRSQQGPSLREWEDEFTVKQAAPAQRKIAPPLVREEAQGPKVPPPQKPEESLFGEDDTFEEKTLFSERISRPRILAPEPSYRKERRVSRVFIFSLLLVVVALGIFYYLTRSDTSLPMFHHLPDSVRLDGRQEGT